MSLYYCYYMSQCIAIRIRTTVALVLYRESINIKGLSHEFLHHNQYTTHLLAMPHQMTFSFLSKLYIVQNNVTYNNRRKMSLMTSMYIITTSMG